MDFLSDLADLSVPALFALVAGVLLVGMFAVLLRSGRWSFPLALVAVVVLVGSLGWMFAADVRASLRELVRTVRELELVRPWWLVLLVAVPLVVIVARKNLRGLGPFRKWSAITLRSLVVACLVV